MFSNNDFKPLFLTCKHAVAVRVQALRSEHDTCLVDAGIAVHIRELICTHVALSKAFRPPSTISPFSLPVMVAGTGGADGQQVQYQG